MCHKGEQTQSQIGVGRHERVDVAETSGDPKQHVETCHNYRCEHFGSSEFVVPREEENTRYACLSCGWLF